jgi:hypothetical protein
MDFDEQGKKEIIDQVKTTRKKIDSITKEKTIFKKFDELFIETLDATFFEEKHQVLNDSLYNALYLKYSSVEASMQKAFQHIDSIADVQEKKKVLNAFETAIDFIFVNSIKYEKLARENDKSRFQKAKKEKDPFGQVAFPETRKDIEVDEENTPIESEVESALIDHFVDNAAISKDHSSLLQHILKTKQYQDIIKEPKISVAYRGMIVKKAWIQNTLKVTDEEFAASTKYPETWNEFPAKFVFKPKRRASTSWTDYRSIAIQFSQDANNASMIKRDEQYSIVLCATVEDNKNKMLQSVNALYNMKGIDEFEDEREIVGLGDIKVSKILWKPYFLKNNS